jgi:plastocyanin
MKYFSLKMIIMLCAWTLLACGGGDSSAEKPAPAAKMEMDKPAMSSSGYMAAAVENGGSIMGKVSFSGEMPQKQKVEVTKDANVCGVKTHYKEDIVVSADGGLSNVVVKITNIAKGKAPDMTSAEVDQNGCTFIPHVSLAQAGAPFIIRNSDGILHNIHTYSEKNDPINIAQPKFKKTIEQTFGQAEAIRVSCDVHNWMNGWIVVADHPYYAVTDENGSFELIDVPAGTYTLEFWQETLGTKTQEVTVQAGGTASANAEFSVGS